MTDSDPKPIKRVVETVYPSQMGLSGTRFDSKAVREAKQEPSLYDDIEKMHAASPKSILQNFSEEKMDIVLEEKRRLDKESYTKPQPSVTIRGETVALKRTAQGQQGTPIISKDDLSKRLRKTLTAEAELSKHPDTVSVVPSGIGLGRENNVNSR